MFYLVQYKREGWQNSNMILRGDIQKHLVVVERLQAKYPFNTYRLKRIEEEEARKLNAEGYVVLTAPDTLNDV